MKTIIGCLIFAALLGQNSQGNQTIQAGFDKPTGIYINWGAYDELSDNVKLDESIAMRQLHELIRLRKQGVQIDYYLMDAFWFDKDGGYREWRKESWPNGPEAWLELCKKSGIKPGLWISSNVLGWSDNWMNTIPEWGSSVNSTGHSLSFSEGGYLPHLIESMQMWVDRGVGMFKFDFADFRAATPEQEKKFSPQEVIKKNVDAFYSALLKFRERNPEVRLIAYNGYGGKYNNTSIPFEQTSIDLRWLNVFDSLFCGDPRLADVPTFNFWRSKDIYSDHQVRQYEFNQVPLKHIDNSAFMVGTTATCYGRQDTAWKGMLMLSLARGGWANTYYGNLDLLSNDDARWFAKVQSLFFPFQEKESITTFGGIPGKAEPYGYLAREKKGSIITLVNPKQTFETIKLPVPGKTRLLFTDSGFSPKLNDESITLGPEQMAVIGVGKFAKRKYELGIENDVRIPVELVKLDATFVSSGKNKTTTTLATPPGKDLRVIWQQFDPAGLAKRSSYDSSGGGQSLGGLLKIRAEQNGVNVPIEIEYDKKIWSGLSWAVAEIRSEKIDPKQPLLITCISEEKDDVEMRAQVFSVQY